MLKSRGQRPTRALNVSRAREPDQLSGNRQAFWRLTSRPGEGRFGDGAFCTGDGATWVKDAAGRHAHCVGELPRRPRSPPLPPSKEHGIAQDAVRTIRISEDLRADPALPRGSDITIMRRRARSPTDCARNSADTMLARRSRSRLRSGSGRQMLPPKLVRRITSRGPATSAGRWLRWRCPPTPPGWPPARRGIQLLAMRATARLWREPILCT